MKEYINLFKNNSKKELLGLYEQFLEAEKLGYIPDNTLGKIRDEYCDYFGPTGLTMLQTDLLHTIADMWYKEQMK